MGLGGVGLREQVTNGHEEAFGDRCVFTVLIVVMISLVYMCRNIKFYSLNMCSLLFISVKVFKNQRHGDHSIRI